MSALAEIPAYRYICVPIQEQESHDGAENWKDRHNLALRNASKIELSDLNKVRPQDTLYIHTHGLYLPNTDPREPAHKVLVESGNTTRGDGTQIGVRRAAERGGEIEMNAQQFAEYLEINALPKHITELHIAACYSNIFAQQLSAALSARGYQYVTVTGYKNELGINQGLGNDMVAGLDEELFTDGKMDWGKWLKLSQKEKLEYSAELHAESYKAGTFVHRNREAPNPEAGKRIRKSVSYTSVSADDIANLSEQFSNLSATSENINKISSPATDSTLSGPSASAAAANKSPILHDYNHQGSGVKLKDLVTPQPANSATPPAHKESDKPPSSWSKPPR